MATPPINGTGSGTIRVTAVLGTGGMATVWAGSQDYGDGWHRPCAVKMVRDDLQHDPDYRRRLRREAEIGLDATVGHPALLTTRGYASFAGARCVLVDLVDGPSLEAILRQGPLPANIVRLVAYELCGALEHLRSLHIAHRDISPANILIDTRGAVFLTDFGLAKRVAEDSPGIARGTFAYASPEMIRDQPVTCASDAYSLGAVLSEMLCGYPPRGADLETVIEHLGRLPRLPRTTPKDLVRVIHGLSAKHPAHRLLPGAAKKLLRGPDANAANVADIRASLGDIARTVSQPDRAPLTTIPALQQTKRSYPIELQSHPPRQAHLRRYASVAAIAALGALFGIVGTLSYVAPERVQLDNAPATAEHINARDAQDSTSPHLATPRNLELSSGSIPPTVHVKAVVTSASQDAITSAAENASDVSQDETVAIPRKTMSHPQPRAQKTPESTEGFQQQSILPAALTSKPQPGKNDKIKGQPKTQTDADIALALLDIDDSVVTAQTPNGGVLALTPMGRVENRFRWKITVIGGYKPTQVRARCLSAHCTVTEFAFSERQGLLEIAAEKGAAKVTLLLSRDHGQEPLILRNIAL